MVISMGLIIKKITEIARLFENLFISAKNVIFVKRVSKIRLEKIEFYIFHTKYFILEVQSLKNLKFELFSYILFIK